jgi:hypothetical protein
MAMMGTRNKIATAARPMPVPRGSAPARALLLIGAGLSGCLFGAPLRVMDETAIPFTAFLSKADFDQRYPGEVVSDVSQLDSGWYVIYQHESLNYYFGPILLESIGTDYLEQLTETVEAAVAERPSIQNYRLELSYEPSEPETGGAGADSSPAQKPADPNAMPPAPQPNPSFWSLIKRIFGF